jgi:hypothetical protein
MIWLLSQHFSNQQDVSYWRSFAFEGRIMVQKWEAGDAKMLSLTSVLQSLQCCNSRCSHGMVLHSLMALTKGRFNTQSTVDWGTAKQAQACCLIWVLAQLHSKHLNLMQKGYQGRWCYYAVDWVHLLGLCACTPQTRKLLVSLDSSVPPIIDQSMVEVQLWYDAEG